MHDTAYQIGSLFLSLYAGPGQKIVDIGSMNINGTLRDSCPKDSLYLGVDIAPGPGVDILFKIGDPLPFPDNTIDAIIASSVFEHDPTFWLTFLEMLRVLKPNGFAYINAPSNGSYHRYPIDCWRFYPDAGLALADYAKRSGLEISLVESFVASRCKNGVQELDQVALTKLIQDEWNDFVAVFIKAPAVDLAEVKFISDRVACTNIWRCGVKDIVNVQPGNEDLALIGHLRQRCAALEAAQMETGASLNQDKASTRHMSEMAIGLSNLPEGPPKFHLTSQIESLRANLAQLEKSLDLLELIEVV